MSTPPLPIRTFDPADEYFVVERRDLPHWAQAGTIVFITWRTWDSIPRAVMTRLLMERNSWLRRHGLDPRDPEWRAHVHDLTLAEQFEFRRLIAERWEDSLDECHGSCVLRQPDLSGIVADSLLSFDGQRYVMTDFVVMPNHIHLLAAFPTAEAMLKQIDSWKHFTATSLNQRLARRGRFWEVDGFDHLVRSEEQFNHFQSYIAANPAKAGLIATEFRHYSRGSVLAEDGESSGGAIVHSRSEWTTLGGHESHE